MVSVIVCSKNTEMFDSLSANIADTIGVSYEIIRIDNSKNQFSIFGAYNEGYRQSQFPYICFIHEDALFRKAGWGEKLVQHLSDPQTGICGLAGRDIITRVPASWKVHLPNIHIIQSDDKKNKRTKKRHKPHNFDGIRRPVIVLDGVMLCARKELFTKICFDEQFDGFHGYDFDICIQSVVAGYKNYVMYDIDVEHFSRGNPDKKYYSNLIDVFKKWENELPVFSNSNKLKKGYIRRSERKGVFKLLNKLARRKFAENEIKEHILYFANLIGYRLNYIQLKCIPLIIFFNRIILRKSKYSEE